VARALRRAAVERLDLRERELDDVLADVGVGGIVRRRRRGVSAERRVGLAVVRDDRLPVLRDLDVELERADAESDRVAEAGERRLRAQAEPAAMGLQVERRARLGRQRRGRQRSGQRRGGERRARGARSWGSLVGEEVGAHASRASARDVKRP
jgi:hypothetical protein